MVAPFAQQVSVSTKPVPPRYWWLKRIALAALIVLLFLLAVRFWWGSRTRSRLDAMLATFVSAGEPIYPKDFDPPDMRDEENAAFLYKQAATLLTKPVGVAIIPEDIYRGTDILETRLDEARTLVEANVAALASARQARTLHLADWGTRYRSPVIGMPAIGLGPQRALAKHMYAAAAYHAFLDEDAESLAYIGDAHALADALRRDPTLISNLVALAIDGQMMEVLEAVLPGMECSGADSSTRNALESLLKQLSDESVQRASMVQVWQIQRMTMFDTGRLIAEGDASVQGLAMTGMSGPPSLVRRLLVWPVRPLFEADTIFMMGDQSARLEATRRVDWRALLTMPLPSDRFEDVLTTLRYPISSVLMWTPSTYVEIEFRGLAMRRMAVTAIAIHLFQADHERRPEALKELVPDYLSTIPINPFAAGDRPIHYRPRAASPILYSVDANGTDDGGDVRDRSAQAPGRSTRLDIPFYLNGDRP